MSTTSPRFRGDSSTSSSGKRGAPFRLGASGFSAVCDARSSCSAGSSLSPSGSADSAFSGVFSCFASAGAASPRFASAWAAAGFPAAAPSPSTVRMVCPTLIFCPGFTWTSLTTPAIDEGTSIVALSVSSSMTAWSLAIVSPGLTSTRTTSPAAMFSPSSGSFKSVMKCDGIGAKGAKGAGRC